MKTLIVSLLAMTLVSVPASALDRMKYSEIWQQPYETMDDRTEPAQASDDVKQMEPSSQRKPSAVSDQPEPDPSFYGPGKLYRDHEEWKVFHEFHR